jgi:hypothetical protein
MKIIQLLLIFSLSLFSNQNLINPTGRTIIDIGESTDAQSVVEISKELQSSPPTYTEIGNDFELVSRTISPIESCPTDNIGNELCPIKKEECEGETNLAPSILSELQSGTVTTIPTCPPKFLISTSTIKEGRCESLNNCLSIDGFDSWYDGATSKCKYAGTVDAVKGTLANPETISLTTVNNDDWYTLPYEKSKGIPLIVKYRLDYSYLKKLTKDAFIYKNTHNSKNPIEKNTVYLQIYNKGNFDLKIKLYPKYTDVRTKAEEDAVRTFYRDDLNNWTLTEGSDAEKSQHLEFITNCIESTIIKREDSGHSYDELSIPSGSNCLLRKALFSKIDITGVKEECPEDYKLGRRDLHKFNNIELCYKEYDAEPSCGGYKPGLTSEGNRICTAEPVCVNGYRYSPTKATCVKQYYFYEHTCNYPINAGEKEWKKTSSLYSDCSVSGACGPYGCTCTDISTQPIVDFCEQSNFTCLSNPEKSCTKMPKDEQEVSISGFEHDRGVVSETYNDTIVVDRDCHLDGVFNETLVKCEIEPTFYCLNTDFTVIDGTDICEAETDCPGGKKDPITKGCIYDTDKSCTKDGVAKGYNRTNPLDNNRNRCELKMNDSICESGTFLGDRDLCKSNWIPKCMNDGKPFLINEHGAIESYALSQTDSLYQWIGEIDETQGWANFSFNACQKKPACETGEHYDEFYHACTMVLEEKQGDEENVKVECAPFIDDEGNEIKRYVSSKKDFNKVWSDGDDGFNFVENTYNGSYGYRCDLNINSSTEDSIMTTGTLGFCQKEVEDTYIRKDSDITIMTNSNNWNFNTNYKDVTLAQCSAKDSNGNPHQFLMAKTGSTYYGFNKPVKYTIPSSQINKDSVNYIDFDTSLIAYGNWQGETLYIKINNKLMWTESIISEDIQNSNIIKYGCPGLSDDYSKFDLNKPLRYYLTNEEKLADVVVEIGFPQDYKCNKDIKAKGISTFSSSTIDTSDKSYFTNLKYSDDIFISSKNKCIHLNEGYAASAFLQPNTCRVSVNEINRNPDKCFYEPTISSTVSFMIEKPTYQVGYDASDKISFYDNTIDNKSNIKINELTDGDYGNKKPFDLSKQLNLSASLTSSFSINSTINFIKISLDLYLLNYWNGENINIYIQDKDNLSDKKLIYSKDYKNSTKGTSFYHPYNTINNTEKYTYKEGFVHVDEKIPFTKKGKYQVLIEYDRNLKTAFNSVQISNLKVIGINEKVDLHSVSVTTPDSDSVYGSNNYLLENCTNGEKVYQQKEFSENTICNDHINFANEIILNENPVDVLNDSFYVYGHYGDRVANLHKKAFVKYNVNNQICNVSKCWISNHGANLHWNGDHYKCEGYDIPTEDVATATYGSYLQWNFNVKDENEEANNNIDKALKLNYKALTDMKNITKVNVSFNIKELREKTDKTFIGYTLELWGESSSGLNLKLSEKKYRNFSSYDSGSGDETKVCGSHALTKHISFDLTREVKNYNYKNHYAVLRIQEYDLDKENVPSSRTQILGLVVDDVKITFMDEFNNEPLSGNIGGECKEKGGDGTGSTLKHILCADDEIFIPKSDFRNTEGNDICVKTDLSKKRVCPTFTINSSNNRNFSVNEDKNILLNSSSQSPIFEISDLENDCYIKTHNNLSAGLLGSSYDASKILQPTTIIYNEVNKNQTNVLYHYKGTDASNLLTFSKDLSLGTVKCINFTTKEESDCIGIKNGWIKKNLTNTSVTFSFDEETLTGVNNGTLSCPIGYAFGNPFIGDNINICYNYFEAVENEIEINYDLPQYCLNDIKYGVFDVNSNSCGFTGNDLLTMTCPSHPNDNAEDWFTEDSSNESEGDVRCQDTSLSCDEGFHINNTVLRTMVLPADGKLPGNKKCIKNNSDKVCGDGAELVCRNETVNAQGYVTGETNDCISSDGSNGYDVTKQTVAGQYKDYCVQQEWVKTCDGKFFYSEDGQVNSTDKDKLVNKSNANISIGECLYEPECPYSGNEEWDSDTCWFHWEEKCDELPDITFDKRIVIESVDNYGFLHECYSEDIACPEGSFLNKISGKCNSIADTDCNDIYTINGDFTKCQTEPSCPQGFIESPDRLSCKQDYSFVEFSCKDEPNYLAESSYSLIVNQNGGDAYRSFFTEVSESDIGSQAYASFGGLKVYEYNWIGPLETSGGDCGTETGACGYNGCKCQNVNPPSYNCKRPKVLSDVETLRHTFNRTLITQEIISTGVLRKDDTSIIEYGMRLKEFEQFKGYTCNEDCGFNIHRLKAYEDNTISFTNSWGEQEDFLFGDCSFRGEILPLIEGNDNLIVDNISELISNIDGTRLEAFTSILNDDNTISKFKLQGHIESTTNKSRDIPCKFNGRVGWTDRLAGITSIKVDKNALIFWDSYTSEPENSGFLGRIDILKEVSKSDKEEGFAYPYFEIEELIRNSDMYNIQGYDNKTYATSRNIMTKEECEDILKNFPSFNIAEVTNALFADKILSISPNHTIGYENGDNYCTISSFKKMAPIYVENAIKIDVYFNSGVKMMCSPYDCTSESKCFTAFCDSSYRGDFTHENLEDNLPEEYCREQVCDGSKDFVDQCGKLGGCDFTSNDTIEDNGKCFKMSCIGTGSLNYEEQKCYKYGCSKDATEQNGRCYK